MWGKFNLVVLHKEAAEQSRVDQLEVEGKALVASYQQQVRVALALIKAAEPKKQGGGRRTVALRWGRGLDTKRRRVYAGCVWGLYTLMLGAGSGHQEMEDVFWVRVGLVLSRWACSPQDEGRGRGRGKCLNFDLLEACGGNYFGHLR